MKEKACCPFCGRMIPLTVGIGALYVHVGDIRNERCAGSGKRPQFWGGCSVESRLKYLGSRGEAPGGFGQSPNEVIK